MRDFFVVFLGGFECRYVKVLLKNYWFVLGSLCGFFERYFLWFCRRGIFMWERSGRFFFEGYSGGDYIVGRIV